ncbi:MAG: DUF2839 family protein [Halothece sp.]
MDKAKHRQEALKDQYGKPQKNSRFKLSQANIERLKNWTVATILIGGLSFIILWITFNFILPKFNLAVSSF